MLLTPINGNETTTVNESHSFLLCFVNIRFVPRKGGIFKPLILCLDDKRVPMFLTFVASGLYHDYVWFTTFYMQKCLYDENGVCSNEANCYDLKFGRVTAFFAYTGIVMLLERPIMKLAPVQWLSAHLPTLVIAQLMVCLHTPVVKWYGGAWIEGEKSKCAVISNCALYLRKLLSESARPFDKSVLFLTFGFKSIFLLQVDSSTILASCFSSYAKDSHS